MTTLLLPSGSPDWNSIPFDVLCSRCEYNLRTLTRPRCPECGLDFDWPSVLHRATHGHALLFENGWRRKPIRSWLWTVWRSLRPRSFWRSMSLHDRLDPPGLCIFALLTVPVTLVFLHSLARLTAKLTFWVVGVIVLKPTYSLPTPTVRVLYPATGQLLKLAYWPMTGGIKYALFPLGMVLAIIGLLFVTCSLQQTLDRYRVSRAHMLRVVAYAALPISLIASVVLLIVTALVPIWLFNGPIPFVPVSSPYFTPRPGTYWGLSAPDIAVISSGIFLMLLVSTLYLQSGFKHYLQLPRSLFLSATAVLVAALFSLTVVSICGLFIAGGYR